MKESRRDASSTRSRWPSLGPWLVFLPLVCGCSQSPEPAGELPPPPPSTPLRVAAASDLQVALPALIEKFTQQSQLQVSPTFDSSGHLAEQIKAGAPFDVFLAANQKFRSEEH